MVSSAFGKVLFRRLTALSLSILVMGATIGAIPALAQPDDSDEHRIAYQYYKEGQRLEQAGDLPDAIEAYRKASSHAQNVKEIHHSLAKLLARTGHNEEAESEFQTALNNDYNYVECRNNFGSFLKRIGQVKDAETQFRQCIEIDKKFPYAYYNLGKLLKEKGDLDGAIENFESATRLKPTFAEAQEALGMAIFERASQGDLRTAADKLLIAVRLLPKNPKIHFHLGLIYATKSDLEAAESEYRKALMCDPRLAAAHWELAKVRYYRGDLDRALMEITQALNVNPTYTRNQEYPDLDLVKVFTLQAQAYEHLGDLQHAIETYQKLVTMRKSDALYAEKLKELDKEYRREIQARKKKPLPYDPAEIDAFVAQGIEAYEEGDLSKAKGKFERGLELHPASFRCMENIAFVNEALGDLNAALASAQKATELNPQYDGAVYNLAYLLERANLPDDAARMYFKFRDLANAYPYDPQHIIELQQNIIREQKKQEYVRKRGY